MKIKNIISCASLLVAVMLSSCSKYEEDDVVIKFKVENKTFETLTLYCDLSIREIQIDDNGEGECVLSDIDHSYASLHYGEESRQIFIEKKDRIEISFDGFDFIKSFKFIGAKERIVDYLNSFSITRIKPSDYQLSFSDFEKRLWELDKESQDLFSARKFQETFPVFYKMESNKIKYAYAQSLLMYPVGHSFHTKGNSYTPDDEYYNSIQKMMVEDEDIIGVMPYREFLKEGAYISYRNSEPSTNFYDKTLLKMKFFIENFKNDIVKQSMLNYLAVEYIHRYGIDNISELQRYYDTYVQIPELRKIYSEVYDKYDTLSFGKPSPDFNATDKDGKLYSLKDFLGKYVYIDIWATWCGPCRKEIPALHNLSKQFSDKNINFLSLSVDTDKDKWLNMINQNKEMAGYQLYLGNKSQFQKNYRVNSIPRFILLDKKGHIIKKEMTLPSSEQTIQFLNSLEGI
ncbi:Thiol-disulfide isomerase or thioredoxin [Saccharicrinis carchari]|uniref:Thiol-disulfide isomerase or thioredoxin n=1 Tax=Saccharicrinis carchari TaxID=1168039 RepID=A0A521B4Y3_SACCC|nr:TlpA disulfide reductase family protein [Saccharicrinis carchari]SMO42133.1 Thiol-disulfide isomerase or thioredoxin [Saccharicrinis carchari]